MWNDSGSGVRDQGSEAHNSGSPAAAAARRGLLFVISAPSGTGKTTVAERLAAERIANSE